MVDIGTYNDGYGQICALKNGGLAFWKVQHYKKVGVEELLWCSWRLSSDASVPSEYDALGSSRVSSTLLIFDTSVITQIEA